LSDGPEIRERDLTKSRGLTWGRGLTWVRLLAWLYWASAAGLAPWIVVLFLTQVRRGQAHQVHILAVGLVLAMMLGLLVTAWLYSRDSWLSVMAASFTATVTFISAWFRGLTQTGTSESAGSIATFLVLVTAIIVLCVITIRAELAALTGSAASRSGTAASGGRTAVSGGGTAVSGGGTGLPHVGTALVRTATHARWLPIALAIAALALVPSVVIVLVARPGVQIATHLRLAWIGLDVFELLALAHTGSALHRRSVTVVVPATITGALLLCDAWINVIPTHAAAQAEGIALAFVEVPMAALSFWVATRAMSYPVADRLS
jgi:hypothetical protein